MGVNGIGNGFQPTAFPHVGAGKAIGTLPKPDPSPVESVIASRLEEPRFMKTIAHTAIEAQISKSPLKQFGLPGQNQTRGGNLDILA